MNSSDLSAREREGIDGGNENQRGFYNFYKRGGPEFETSKAKIVPPKIGWVGNLVQSASQVKESFGKMKSAVAGDRTRVTRVTGGNTYHYTTTTLMLMCLFCFILFNQNDK